MSTVLVIAPHPDDEAIGCGGTIRLHADRGDRVVVVFLTSGELGLKHLPPQDAWRIREAESAAAAEILGISRLEFLRQPDWFIGEHIAATAAALRPIIEREQPATIVLPHPLEWHPDHQASLPVVRAALRALPGAKPELRGYEVWTALSTFEYVNNITTQMARKLSAVRCYASQLGGFRYDRAVRGLNQYRGVIAAKSRYAEVFAPLTVNEDSRVNDEGCANA